MSLRKWSVDGAIFIPDHAGPAVEALKETIKAIRIERLPYLNDHAVPTDRHVRRATIAAGLNAVRPIHPVLAAHDVAEATTGRLNAGNHQQTANEKSGGS